MKKRILKIIGIGISIGLFLLFLNLFHLSVPCMFYETTHLYCAGCGLTRCVHSILHLDFYQAFRYNVLFMPLIFPTTIIMIISIVQYIRGKSIDDVLILKLIVKVWPIIVGFILMFMVLRNIFSMFAPTVVR